MKITNPHPDPDVNALRRVFVAAKSARKRQNKQMTRWLGGELDDSPYFQNGLAEFKKCKAEGLLK